MTPQKYHIFVVLVRSPSKISKGKSGGRVEVTLGKVEQTWCK